MDLVKFIMRLGYCLAVFLGAFMVAEACGGTSGAAFLKIAPGARPVGMGGAYTAVKGDVNALYYNPAGLGSIEKPQVGAMHTEWIDDIKYNFAAGAFSLKRGVLGVSATLLTMGELEGRGADREPSGEFRAYDFAMQMSYAAEISDRSLLGSTLKYVRQQIDDETANGVAVDLGLQRELGSGLSLGVAVRNLGPGMKFISETYSLPLTFSFGTGLVIGGIRLGADTSWEAADGNVKLAFGTEYLPVQFLSLRGGYFLNALRSAVEPDKEKLFSRKNGLGGGIGVKVLGYRLDYAVVPYAELGTTQRMSFLFQF
ncbi:MAG: PorV/PorQ family protein [Elusimicrobia bacterium]|nr:PorV/PorQ family protein [Elusimicrobiota bacterium]